MYSMQIDPALLETYPNPAGCLTFEAQVRPSDPEFWLIWTILFSGDSPEY